MKPEPENYTTINLSLTVASDRLSLFSPLLGQGFSLKVRTGCSIRELLCRQLGVRADYVDQRIQTIFLDGKTVDDVDTAMIRQDSTLALSAALPGLAGSMSSAFLVARGVIGGSTFDRLMDEELA